MSLRISLEWIFQTVNTIFIFTILDSAKATQHCLLSMLLSYKVELKDSGGLADNSLSKSDSNFSRLLWTLPIPSVLFPCLSEK